MKKFCESLRKHAVKIIDLKKDEVVTKRAAGIMWKCKKTCKYIIRGIQFNNKDNYQKFIHDAKKANKDNRYLVNY